MKRVGVKICGVTRIRDAEVAVELGADFVGLNFWPGSPRYLTPEQARPIARAVAGKARLVGVWVDPPRSAVRAACEELELDLLQIHGESMVAAADWFPDRVICGLRLAAAFDGRQLAKLANAWGFLIDSAPDGVYGGTGRSWSYERIADLETLKPILLAGGLRPDNVCEAILRSGVDIVDVCSGVESSPGVKSQELIERFIREVRHAEKDR